MDRNITLNSVRQHNYCITQGNYIGYMFRLLVSHLQAYFWKLSHKTLCTHWDPIMFTSMEYIKLNLLSQKLCCANCVYISGIHKIGSMSRKMCNAKSLIKNIKCVKFLKVYIGVHQLTNISPITVCWFLELWDTIYLLVTSEYVFWLLLCRSGRVIM
jgi:hypothetical protein